MLYAENSSLIKKKSGVPTDPASIVYVFIYPDPGKPGQKGI
jgi:hypothetical protein